MACGRRRSATCNGSRSNCPRAAFTFTVSRMGFPACTRSAVMRYARCASSAVIIPKTPTYSFPSAAGQSVPSVSTGSFSASARPQRCHSRSTRTCFATPVGSSSPTMATTRAPCSTTSGTRTSSTRSDTPKWRPTGSRTFGGADDDGGRTSPCGLPDCFLSPTARAAPPSPHTVRSRPRWRSHLARNALPRADRGVRREHQPALWFGRLERGRRRSFYGRGFYRSLDQFDRAASLRCKRGLDVLDHGFKLLVRQVLERIAVLDLVLTRDQHGDNFQPHPGLLSAHLRDGLFFVSGKIPQQCANHRLAQLVTRASRSSGRVAGRDASGFVRPGRRRHEKAAARPRVRWPGRGARCPAGPEITHQRAPPWLARG